MVIFISIVLVMVMLIVMVIVVVIVVMMVVIVLAMMFLMAVMMVERPERLTHTFSNCQCRIIKLDKFSGRIFPKVFQTKAVRIEV